MKEKLQILNPTIVRAQKGHAGAIVDVLREAWISTYPNIRYNVTERDVLDKFGDPTEKETRIGDYLEKLDEQAGVIYMVASISNQVRGFIYAISSGSSLYISALYIDPKFQNNGLGGLLLQECLSSSPYSTNVSVDVVAYNTKAIRFYNKAGFIDVGPSQTDFSLFPNGVRIPERKMIKKHHAESSIRDR